MANIDKYRHKGYYLSMASLNISMPDDMRQFVDERTKTKAYSTPTEYVRALIREDQKRAADERLESLLLEGLDSGPATEMTQEDWVRIRQAAREELRKRRKK